MRRDKVKAGVQFSLFGFLKVTLEGEFSNIEQDTAARVLRILVDHAALYRKLELEYAGKVVKSIERLRRRLGGEVKKLPAQSGVANSLLGLQGACREFLATVDDLDHQNQRIVTANEGAKARRNAAHKLYGYQERLISPVEHRGTSRLLGSTKTNLLEVEPFTQWSFAAALERLRVKVGAAVVGLGSIAGEQRIPNELLSIIGEQTNDAERNVKF